MAIRLKNMTIGCNSGKLSDCNNSNCFRFSCKPNLVHKRNPVFSFQLFYSLINFHNQPNSYFTTLSFPNHHTSIIINYSWSYTLTKNAPTNQESISHCSLYDFFNSASYRSDFGNKHNILPTELKGPCRVTVM